MKYAVYPVILILFVAIFHFIVQSRLNSGPIFITRKLDDLLADKSLMDSIGGTPVYEFVYNVHDYELRDTVEYVIKIRGEKKALNYKATQIRKADGAWILLTYNLNIQKK
jgi:hypothetical protein